MTSRSLPLSLGDGRLFCVPAIHYDYVFAAAVRFACLSGPGTLEAIAVELGPETAREARSWMREILLETGGRLPLALGLVLPQRLIKVSLKDKAFALQRKTGVSLHELPADVLAHELGFHDRALLCLSPTDSIVEAIRCSIELDIPLYGIDLEESPGSLSAPLLMEDSPKAISELAGFTKRNAPCASLQRDEEVDIRREVVMAARLKTILERHKEVLFTGGLAHWSSLQRLLPERSLMPARCLDGSARAVDSVRRVFVHPAIAQNYMDRFPALALHYEKWRGEWGQGTDPPPLPCRSTLFLDQLEKACRSYFSVSKNVPKGSKSSYAQDMEALPQFQAYFRRQCLLNAMEVPTLGHLMTAAEETLSQEFTKVIAETFMDIPWALPEEHPELPLLYPSEQEKGNSITMVRLKYRDRESQPFSVGSKLQTGIGGPASQTPSSLKRFVSTRLRIDDFGGLHTWSPWDYMNASLCLAASARVRRVRNRPVTEEFQGSLFDGLDFKATLRGFSRGKETYYIKNRIEAPMEVVNVTAAFPIVWIIDPHVSIGGKWMVLRESTWGMREYVTDRERLQKARLEMGQNMVSSICYVQGERQSKRCRNKSLVEVEPIFGQVIFQPPFCNHRQFARWAEHTGYRRNPFSNSCVLGSHFEKDLTSYYEGKLGVSLHAVHWTTALILMGLPFAEDLLIVVAPCNHKLEPVVKQRAKDLGVVVKTIPLETFPEKDVKRMATCHMVPVLAHDPVCVYSREAEEAIGETQIAYSERLPRSWLHFEELLDAQGGSDDEFEG